MEDVKLIQALEHEEGSFVLERGVGTQMLIASTSDRAELSVVADK